MAVVAGPGYDSGVNARILSRSYFAGLAAIPDERIDLVAASVVLAQDEDPKLRLSEVAGGFADLAARSPRLPGAADRPRAEALAVFLFREEGFSPNEADYYDPANSFLDHVLQRRTGIPITLSLVLLEVGRRLGLPLVGVAFPGRFLVRLPGDPDFFIDPFARGRILSARGCESLYRRQTDGKGAWSSEFLDPASRKRTLQRLLRNLKEIYLRQEDIPRCLAIAEKLAALFPEDLEEIRDRGVLSLHSGSWVRALADMETYLAGRPEAEDAELIRSHVKVVRGQIFAGAGA